MKKIIFFIFLLLPVVTYGAASPRFIEFHKKTMEFQGTEQKKKEPKHKYGVHQDKLDMYRSSHPDFNFPTHIKNLKEKQAEQLLKYFYDNYRFGELKYPEIQEKVWDMFVEMELAALEKNINESIKKYYKFGGYVDKSVKTDYPDFYAPFGSVATTDLLNGMKSKNVPKFLKLLDEVKY